MFNTCNVIKNIVSTPCNADNNTSRAFRITGSKQNVSFHKVNKLVRSVVYENSVVLFFATLPKYFCIV